ncbi:MAG TPA: hypothetical protein V6C81_29360 [Planktothrix sp.]|jgi:hypothetical protein
MNQTLVSLLDAFVEVAVVNAMNLGAASIRMPPPANGTDEAKEKLMKLVTPTVDEKGMVTLDLATLQSIRVGPLYSVFGAVWRLPAVRTETLKMLRAADVLQGIQFDLELV